MSPRLLAPAFALGVLISLGLFWFMQYLVLNNQRGFAKTENIKMVDFVRLKREPTAFEKKQRTLPEKPPLQDRPPPPKMPLEPVKQLKTDLPDVDVPNLDIPLASNRFSGSVISGLQAGAVAQAGTGVKFSGEVVPLVRVPPSYPMRAASRRIEGWVKVEFTITESGTVKDPRVVAAKPRKIFDRAAKQAILKWKFKPKLMDGKPVERRAEQTLEFKLSR